MSCTEIYFDADAAWETIAPLLSEAMQHLDGIEHNALIFGGLDGLNPGGTGLAPGTSNGAGRRLATRAIKKLRSYFARRGVVVSPGLLVGVLQGHLSQAVSPGRSRKEQLEAMP
jgi:hypothetical protein